MRRVEERVLSHGTYESVRQYYVLVCNIVGTRSLQKIRIYFSWFSPQIRRQDVDTCRSLFFFSVNLNKIRNDRWYKTETDFMHWVHSITNMYSCSDFRMVYRERYITRFVGKILRIRWKCRIFRCFYRLSASAIFAYEVTRERERFEILRRELREAGSRKFALQMIVF